MKPHTTHMNVRKGASTDAGVLIVSLANCGARILPERVRRRHPSIAESIGKDAIVERTTAAQIAAATGGPQGARVPCLRQLISDGATAVCHQHHGEIAAAWQP